MPRIALRPDYGASSIRNFGRPTLINMHAELAEGKGLFPIVGQAGNVVKTVLKAPGRGQFMHLGVHYAVGGDTLYRIEPDWNATVLGTVAGISPVSWMTNSTQIGILGAPNLYTFDRTSGTVAAVDDPDFPGATGICAVNGFGIFTEASNGTWGTTRTQDFRQIDATDIATAEASADPLVGCIIVQNQLVLFGTESIEVWANTGEGSPPFARALVIDAGCAAGASIKLFDGSAIWLGRTRAGGLTVMRSNGGQISRVATHAIERLIEAASDPTLAVGFTYVRDGHEFYELALDNGSVRLDAATGLWTQTASGAWPAGSEPPATRFINAVMRNGHPVFQDALGSLYAASNDLFQDNGAPLLRVVRTPVVAGNGKRITINRVELEMETGRAKLADDPMVAMSISRDGGHTWTNCGTQPAGVTGDYRRRVEWRRLGQVDTAMLEFRFSDNAPFNVMGVYADIAQDRHP